jgi:hypothetical protein
VVTLCQWFQWGCCSRSGRLGGFVQLGLDQAGNGEELGFLVEVEVLLAFQVNGQSRNTKDWSVSNLSLFQQSIGGRTWSVNLDQFLLNASICGTHHDTASNTQITVKPCKVGKLAAWYHINSVCCITSMPNAASIRFNADLKESLALLFANRLDPQNGRVRVRSDHGDRVARLTSQYKLIYT